MDWREFERIITRIHQQLAPEAEVRHNQFVQGVRTGRRRQIDVTIRQKIGVVETLGVVECRRFSRKIEISHVEGFAAKLQDVGAHYGVMVSRVGFDAGATAAARAHRILLIEHQQASEIDWVQAVGVDAWMNFLHVDIRLLRLSIHVADAEQSWDRICPVVLFLPDGRSLGRADQVLVEAFKASDLELPVGKCVVEVATAPAPLIEVDGERLPVSKFRVELFKTVTAYPVNLRLGDGEVLRDAMTGQARYTEVNSAGIDWRELMLNATGVELSDEQYQSMNAASRFRVQRLDPGRLKRYIRLNITRKE